IEQCWDFAKREYWKLPLSSMDTALERNMVAALNMVTGKHLKRFMDTCCKGHSGSQAAWAAKKYCGHRVIPEGVLAKLD
ncbi:hypothetical protein WOLCODRAFT_34306, partial [Wolfiporia cocos MD-104 SS10]